TGIISANPHLNQRFVKEEIFRPDTLDDLGISLKGEKILSKYSASETKDIFEDISQKIKNKVISTRNNRGNVLDVLSPENQELVDRGRNKTAKEVTIKGIKEDTPPSQPKQRQARRTRNRAAEIFGGPLYLNPGDVSNLYRDIT